MTPEPGSARLWPALRQLPERTPLRVKLIAAVLALVAIALIVISIASASVLSGYLQGRADSEVVAEYRQLLLELRSQMPMGGGFSAINGFPYITEIRNRGGFILTPAGSIRPDSHEPAVPTNAAWLQANAGHLVTIASFSGRDDWRLITRQISYRVYDPASGTVTTTTGTLIVGADLGDIKGITRQLANIDIVVSLILLLALATVGVAVVRASLLPLAEIEQTAAAIARGDLTRRVPERDPRTEVGRLGRSLNWMLGQIETAFRARSESEMAARRSEERMRQFVADASHELRTPLTAISGYAEYYRQRLNQKREATNGANVATAEKSLSSDPEDSPTRTDLAWIMQRIEQESLRMRGLVEDLLLLARLDEQRPSERRPVDLLTLAADAVKDARVIAPNRQIR
jgi:two-component system OmpR family sensor kinase